MNPNFYVTVAPSQTGSSPADQDILPVRFQNADGSLLIDLPKDGSGKFLADIKQGITGNKQPLSTATLIIALITMNFLIAYGRGSTELCAYVIRTCISLQCSHRILVLVYHQHSVGSESIWTSQKLPTQAILSLKMFSTLPTSEVVFLILTVSSWGMTNNIIIALYEGHTLL